MSFFAYEKPGGPALLCPLIVERLSSFRGDFLYSVYTRVLSACFLLGGLSSFGVSIIGGFTVHCVGGVIHLGFWVATV